MCGIAGLFQYGQPLGDEAHRSATRLSSGLRRRGPDDEGFFAAKDQGVLFVHRRLAIIDPTERSNQPMISEKTGSVLVFNGEIYNFREIREDLERNFSVQFRSAGDSEVILRGYDQWGRDVFRRLDGMFAVALWDPRSATVVLARDRFGIKPLYFSDNGRRLMFSSSARALGEVTEAGISTEGEALFLAYGFVPEPATIFAGIGAVDAGTTVEIGSNGQKSVRSFWSLQEAVFSHTNTKSSDAVAEEFAYEFRRSVRSHLVSDVGLSSFLSAGVDSAAILATAVEGGAAITAVTIGFDDFKGTTSDEVEGAARIAGKLGVRHLVKSFSSPDARSVLKEYFAAMDQPTVDGFNTFLASRATQEHGLKVSFSGVGADELMGTYHTFSRIPPLHKWRLPLFNRGTEMLFRMLSDIPGGLGQKAARLSRVRRGEFWSFWYALRGLRSPEEISRELGGRMTEGDVADLIRKETERHVSSAPSACPVSLLVFLLETAVYMRSQLLKDADWASMHHSLELRVPFCSAVLFDLAVQLNVSGGGPVGKQVLFRLPELKPYAWLLERRKTGFNVPRALMLPGAGKSPVQAWSDRALAAFRSGAAG